MDQGSVVVLRRRTTHLEFVVMSFVHRDLNYSGLYPQLQHLIPDPTEWGVCAIIHRIGSGISTSCERWEMTPVLTTCSCPETVIIKARISGALITTI